MANSEAQSRVREKHQPYSPVRIFYDGSAKGDGSLVALTSESAEWFGSYVAYVMTGDAATLPLLYHYTSLESFESIVDSGDFWLSDYRSMNDYAEIQTALEELHLLCLGRLSNELRSKTTWDIVFEELMRDFQCFIFSLARTHESLGLFRAYAGPKGIAMGLPIPLFIEGLDSNWIMGDALYSKEEHIYALQPIAGKICSILTNQHDMSILRQEISKLRDDFFAVAPLLKNVGFQEEQEVRLYTRGDTVRQYTRQDSNGTEVKFIKLSWLNCLVQSSSSDLAFDTLFVSPGRDSADRMKKVCQILGDRQRKFRTIQASRITAIL